jgi:hypothetical protein
MRIWFWDSGQFAAPGPVSAARPRTSWWDLGRALGSSIVRVMTGGVSFRPWRDSASMEALRFGSRKHIHIRRTRRSSMRITRPDRRATTSSPSRLMGPNREVAEAELVDEEVASAGEAAAVD